MSGRAFTWFNQ